MAIYHLTAKIVSRGKGDSSVAAAAYQSRSRLVDERTGELHNYSRKAGELLFEGIYAPKDAPDWARDRASLWNHVEAFERRRDAQVARSFDIALPCELTLEQNRYAIQDWVRENFTRKGLIADVAIHAPGVDGDDRNIHAHVLVVMRKLDGPEFAAKKERAATIGDRKDELEALRESWEKIGNRHLERHGFAPTLDRRSFEDRGIERVASLHLGKQATALERDGIPTDRGDINREIATENERRATSSEIANCPTITAAPAHQVADEIRAGETNQPTREETCPAETAREAVQAMPEAAAPSAPEHSASATGEPQRAAAGVFSGAAPQAAEQASFGGRVLGMLGSGIRAFAGLFDWLAPSPKLAAEKNEQNAEAVHQRNADGVREWQAHNFRSSQQQEHDPRLAQTLGANAAAEASRQEQAENLSLADRFGMPPTSEATRGREPDSAADLARYFDSEARDRLLDEIRMDDAAQQGIEITDSKAAKKAALAQMREETEQSISRPPERSRDRDYGLER